MPCLKPVGQIILGMDALAGAPAPTATQSCANGVVKLEATKGEAKASLEYVLGMTSNLYAVRGQFTGINTPVWLRLLGVDADRRGQWRAIAAKMAPYPTWDTPEGPVFCAIRGVEPKVIDGDHFGEAAQKGAFIRWPRQIHCASKSQRRTSSRTSSELMIALTGRFR